MFLNHSRVGAPAWQIARAVQRGDTTATAVIADHLDHAGTADRVLAALRVLRAADALAEAETVDDQADLGALPLAGVPVAVSEDTAVAGVCTWNGSAAARGAVAESDHEVVRRLRGAGALVLGVARISELGLWPTTDDASAVTRNPWRADRSPGGAAGGVAAAVAAGVVPIALAPERLGSVRVPAASCGLVSLSPGGGGNGAADAQRARGGADGYGILATTVADLALGLAVISGSHAAPAVSGEAAPQGTGRLRVAISGRAPWPGGGADGPSRAGLRTAARILVGLGHDVVAARPRYPALSPATSVEVWTAHAYRAASLIADAQLQPRTRRLAALGARSVRRGRVDPAAALRQRLTTWFTEGGWDILVVPALAGPPPRAQRWSARPWPANLGGFARTASLGVVWSLVGLPAITVPVGVRADGLPVAVQLVGAKGYEARLLRVAAHWERVAPWRRHPPGWPRAHRHAAPGRTPVTGAAAAQTRATRRLAVGVTRGTIGA